MINNEEEYYEYKEKLRKEAFAKEMDRMISQVAVSRRNLIISVVFAGIFLLLFGAQLFFNLTNRTYLGKAETPLIITDTIALPADTVYQQPNNPFGLTSFYSVQVGAFKTELVPELKDLEDFPMVRYTSNDNYCVAFGKFENIQFAEKGLMFLRRLGFTNTMIVKIENGERVKIVL